MTDTQKYLRTLAEEVVSDISTLEPFQCKELLGSFVAELFAVVAEEELREQRRQRQAEGIAEAKKKGVRLGRPPTPLPENFHENYQRWKSGEITCTTAARACGLPLSTFRDKAAVYGKAILP